MPDPVVRFDDSDIDALIPEEGDYRAYVHSVRQRTSERGNSTIQVVYEVLDVDPAWDRVSEYFVIAGPNRRALAISLRRLHSLCRACGLDPGKGDEVNLAHLVGIEIEIRVGHEIYDGRKRLRVLAHRHRV
jgi:hypothetical protein